MDWGVSVPEQVGPREPWWEEPGSEPEAASSTAWWEEAEASTAPPEPVKEELPAVPQRETVVPQPERVQLVQPYVMSESEASEPEAPAAWWEEGEGMTLGASGADGVPGLTIGSSGGALYRPFSDYSVADFLLLCIFCLLCVRIVIGLFIRKWGFPEW